MPNPHSAGGRWRTERRAARLRSARVILGLVARRGAARVFSRRRLRRRRRRSARDGLPPGALVRRGVFPRSSRARIRRSVHSSLPSPRGGKRSSCCSIALLGGDAALELMEDLAQLLKGAVDANLDGADLAPHQAGYFLVLEFLEAAENQDLSFVFGQVHQCALQQQSFLFLLCRIGRRDGCGWFTSEWGLGLNPASLIEASVAGDLVHPGEAGGC